MKFNKFIITIVTIFVCSISFAQTATVGPASTNAGAVATFDSHNVYESRNPPAASAFAPSLTSSIDTCMGSTSGAVSSAIVGVAIGSTYIDKNCQTLKNSRELWNMGQRSAALARMCMDDLNREAMELSGYVCPTPPPNTTTSVVHYTDPIVRARLGLPPLKN